MTQEGRFYTADQGNIIVRKRDGIIMGEDICLGTADSIDNYIEITIADAENYPADLRLLEKAKARKISEIEKYDRSDAVNSFYLGDTPMWLTREERTQIDESINAYEATGATQMTKYFGGVAYTFPLAQWKQMLDALIVYASEALNVTEGHKAAVLALESIENVEAYDYTVGYPEILVFPVS